MKLREIVRYELGYRSRSVSTWLYAGVLFVVALWMSLATGADGDGGVHANAPAQLVWGYGRAGIFGILVTAALFGDAAVRDVDCGMDPLLFTSPLAKAEYLGGRFIGALAANAVVLIGIPLGLLGMTGLLAYIGPEVLGPFRLFAYVQPLFVFALPNLVLTGALLFTIGVLARHVVPVYLGAIGIFIGCIVALNYANEIGSPVLATLADPLGLVTMERTTALWTAAERNARLVGLPADLALNRALWLLVAAAALALLHRRFRFTHAGDGRRPMRRRAIVAAPSPERVSPVDVPRVSGSFGYRTTLRQTFAVARHSLAESAASPWFAVVLFACVGLPLLWGWNVGDSVFDTSTWPVTLLVAETVLSQRSVPLFYVLIIVFAAELVWKEREVRAAEIADAAPLPTGAALAGRFLALTGMIAMFVAASIVGGILIQALHGYYDFELGLYLRAVFGLQFADYVLFGALAITVHVLVNHKNLGHMLVVLAFIAINAAGPVLGIDHHLLLYGTDPGWTYSDMNGFGPFVWPFVWFKLYWAAWALLLIVLAVMFWVRGHEPGIRSRFAQALARFRGPIVRTAGVAAALMVALGVFIFYNTNVLNAYRASRELGAPRAEYEKRYARYRNLAQPTIERAALRAEIHPDAPAVDLRGRFQLVNRTGEAIETVHVYVAPEVDTRSISFDRAAAPSLVDEEVGYRIYALEQPLAPGGSMQLVFDVAFRPRGFPNSGIQTDVVGNGAYFNRTWMPFIGYQPMFELADDEARERFGLGPRPPMPGPDDDADAIEHRWGWRDADLVQVSTIVGTAVDQIAVTSGVLRRSWTEPPSPASGRAGRRYFHWETEEPTAFGATFFSAKYAVLEDRWKDVSLRVFHHPAHDDNLHRMVRSMKASLDYLTGEFGDYPYSELRIVEIPRYGGFGSAHPYTIAFTEDAFFSRVRDGEIDQPFYGTAHEVAHTWWGGLVRGGSVRGEGFLGESLANYSAMMITEKTFGPEVARRVYDFQMERYLRGRATQSREVPLLEVEDQPYIAYRKGAIAMYTLREHIGEERVNAALRRYFQKHRDGRPPYPSSLDLYAELRASTPEPLHPLLEDLFETITLWDVRTEQAVVQPTGTGEYLVTLDVAARKMRADGYGNETAVPMDDLVDIGVFARGTGDGPGTPLYLQRHRIRSGRQTIRVTVPRLPSTPVLDAGQGEPRDGGEPVRAGIDPWRKLIDRERNDNVVELGSAGPQPAAGS